MPYPIKTPKAKEQKSYAFTTREIELDNKIFEIMDKGTREDKVRLLKILKNRTENIKRGLK
jgi:hypothetical protein